MSDFTINFQNPWLLFLLIPALLCILIPFFRIPKKFRRTRNRVISVVLQSITAVLCVTLIAGIRFNYTIPNRENELMILVDMSDSSAEQEDGKDDYVQTILNVCDDGFKVGIVTFGLEPVYAAPLTYDTREAYRQYLGARTPDTSATDIAAALDFAADQFENPHSSKIVLLSDGFETDSEAQAAASLIAAQGIKIDTVCFPGEEHGEIQLTDASLPQDKVVLGQTVNLQVTVESSVAEPTNVSITLSDKGFPDAAVSFTLQKGEQVLTIPHVFQSAGMHDLLFNIECSTDHVTKNNLFQTYLDISVFEDILILENVRGEADYLESILSEDYTVNTLNIHDDTDLLPQDSKELCGYQQVILVNISNADLTDGSMPKDFDAALYEYVHDLGGSLLTVGGRNDTDANGNPVPHAYNRADLEGSLLQEMLPVQTIDYSPPIAVVIVIDTSGSMSGNLFPSAIEGARETVEALSSRDYCGVMSFNTSASEEISVMPMAQKQAILDSIDRLSNGSSGGAGSGGTVFSGAIDRAGRALASVDVDRKHIILITDGNPSDHLEASAENDNNAYGKYIDWNYEQGITMSVITLGLGNSTSNFEQMEQTAERGHGKHYNFEADELHLVGDIMKQDLAAITLAEMQEGIEYSPTIGDYTSVFTGISSSDVFPTLTGYYGVRQKDDESVVVPLEYGYIPIYAAWQFGAGNVGSFMCDLSGIWSAAFVSDELGIRLIKNIAESLAPLQPPEPDRTEFVIEQIDDNYSTRLNVFSDCAEGESVRVTVTPRSEQAISYYGSNVPVTPVGNNVGFDFSILCTGVYDILIEKVDAEGNVLADVVLRKSFSYSEEYDAIRDESAGAEFMAALAQNGGGNVIEDPVQIFASFEKTIRKTYDPLLPFAIISIVFILLSIAVRKFKFKWLHEIIRERKEMKQHGENMQGGGNERS